MFTGLPGPFGDIDNDGDVDIVLGGYLETLNHLFINDSYGNLEEIEAYTVPNFNAVPFLLDLNSNSFLDLVFLGNDSYILYNDSSGAFHDPVSMNIQEPEEDMLHSVSWGDADNDGDTDLFCGYSYFNPGENPGLNALYINQGGGDFLKFNDSSGYFTDRAMTPSVNWIDYDNDNDMDLFVLNSWEYMNSASELSKLYINMGNLQFEEYIFEPEIYKDSHKNSSAWADIDNDGDLDLYITIEKNDFGTGGHVSPTKFNLLFENQGNGLLTEITDHELVNESSHGITFTDHDNDGDLDALLIRYSWSNDGHNTFFINEGNANSWINFTCIGTHSNKSAFGTRITAKTIIGDSLVTQTREITPMHGHFTYPSSRVHFGLADADILDSLIINWPSGHIDNWLDVPAREFYRAIEDSVLEINLQATNYIQYHPVLPDTLLMQDNTYIFDLADHYSFITGDSIPHNAGELTYLLHDVSHPEILTASVEGSILSITTTDSANACRIYYKVDNGFTARVDQFQVTVNPVGINTESFDYRLIVSPNPFTTSTTLSYELQKPESVTLSIYNHLGVLVYKIEENQPRGSQQLIWSAERYSEGIYYYRLKAGDAVANGKMVKVK
jgi:hypothetical protein